MTSRISDAADLLAAAWRTNVRLAALPPTAQPASLDEAHAVQLATAERLGERIGGWKADIRRPIRAPVFASRLLRSPARIPASGMLRRLVEGEVAFYFDRAMPPAARDYAREEVAAHVSACVAIEVVDSRYQDQSTRPELDRVADLLGNSALVFAEPVKNWQHLDFATIPVSLTIDGRTVVNGAGGHGTGDPLGVCTMLVNGLRTSTGIAAGQVVTTGTYTGAPVMEIGSTAVMRVAGLGSAEVTFTQ